MISMEKRIVDVACAILERDGTFLLAQRPAGKPRAEQWEFPGGKLNRLETEKEALLREIKEELGIEIGIGQRLTASLHLYEDIIINLIPYLCTIAGGEPRPAEHARIDWVTPDSVSGYDLAPADRAILKEYLAHLKHHR